MKTDWKKGDFAVRRGTLCRFKEDVVNNSVHVELVSNYEHGAGVCCGGAIMGGGASDFRPVTSVEHILMARAYEALKLKEEAQRQINIQEDHYKVFSAALKAHKDAERASIELMKQMTEAVIVGELE